MWITSFISQITSIKRANSNIKTYAITKKSEWKKLKWQNKIRQEIKKISWYFKVVNKENIIFRKILILISNILITSLDYSQIIHKTYI